MLIAWASGEASSLIFRSELGDVVFKEGTDYEPFPLSGGGDIENADLVDISMFGCETIWYMPQLLRRLNKRRPPIMLIRRGGCKFQDKISLAHTYGAGAILIYNQGDDPYRFGLASNPYYRNGYGLPIFFLSNSAGLRLTSLGSGVVSLKHSVIDYECSPFSVHPETHLTADFSHEVVSTAGENHTAQFNLYEQRLSKEDLLLKVASSGYYYVADQLIKEVGVDYVNSDGQGVLHYGRTPEVISLFITSGADIELKDKSGWTPLVTNIRGDQPQAVKTLLSYGADPNRLVNDISPLGFACQVHAGMCQLLLDAGADPNFRSSVLGESALHRAVKRNDFEVVAVLLSANVSTDHKDVRGKTAIEYAKSKGMHFLFSPESELEKYLNDLETPLKDIERSEAIDRLKADTINSLTNSLLDPNSVLDIIIFGLLSHTNGPFRGPPFPAFFSFFRGFFNIVIFVKVCPISWSRCYYSSLYEFVLGR